MMEWIKQWFTRNPSSTDRFFGSSPPAVEHWLRQLPENPPERFFGNPSSGNSAVIDAILRWIERGVVALYNYIRPSLPEIITLAIVGCALALMVTGDNNKWYGRIVMVGVVGFAILMIG